MPESFSGIMLRIDLTSSRIERQEFDEMFYRMYMGGSAIGTYFLLKETSPDTDALGEGNVLTIACSIVTGAPVSGVSRFCVAAISPETGAVGDTQAGGSFGPMLKSAGFDAIVITGRAKKPSYILVDDDSIQIRDATELTGKTVLAVHDILAEEYGKKNVSILQCGPAGERLVRFACLMADLNDVAGRTGMGAVFGSKNLRAVVVRTSRRTNVADAEEIKQLARVASENLSGMEFPNLLARHGTPGVLGFQTRAGNLSTHNYSRSFHEDYQRLDGAEFEPKIGSGKTTCFACVVGCRKKVKCQEPYEVTDRLGGPEFETLGLLGANLDITDPVAVSKANELCNNYGIDTITMGALAAYLFECAEKGLISDEQIAEGRVVRFGDADALLWLIEQVANRRGIGELLAEGFEPAMKTLGPATAPFAINVKNHGLPAHMAQVKPSQALMYAVCPIGADHMSSEHDWLLASDSEAAKGLGILGRGRADICDLDKVRMTVYSQYYYSLLDALCLCMFCWGPGSLFDYHCLERLIRCTTGWECTFWELMKVGQRRVNMMRQLNAKRGFSRKEDMLPARLFEPLPDGPAKGRCVNKNDFLKMLDQYYALMGWDPRSGNPTEGVLLELGLDWTI
ncbi:MAG: aldehyde:ferredoxin oxidoreductase [Candidatus Abyssobacteria bacterium SURF_17]|uniref:Aldehyde:ferredoxin oxidoreductase n=1 Tax=Candidatus Abyssobacteria bacterium SURF_17 TaxID=2093361 RepID=A0A419F6U5_9BACT|nr:MAG: aldehyde:ferredoxin oxidoreductase [Candidatus Abyssubacteria bacterium SURF_17]